MATVIFPAAPANGATHDTGNGVVYTYRAGIDAWTHGDSASGAISGSYIVINNGDATSYLTVFDPNRTVQYDGIGAAGLPWTVVETGLLRIHGQTSYRGGGSDVEYNQYDNKRYFYYPVTAGDVITVSNTGANAGAYDAKVFINGSQQHQATAIANAGTGAQAVTTGGTRITSLLTLMAAPLTLDNTLDLKFNPGNNTCGGYLTLTLFKLNP